MSRRTLIIGLTGGIGSGKTTVSGMFAARNVPVIDADVIARELLRPGNAAEEEVKTAFGNDILDVEGNIDRAALRRIVFGDAVLRAKLESILHPLVRQEILARIQSISEPYCVVVIPLLIETGYDELVDRILVVDCPLQTQIDRASQRDHSDSKLTESIAATQVSRETRLQAADDAIDNSSDLAALEPQVAALDSKYRLLAKKHSD